MSKLFDTQYIETPLRHYYGETEKVLSPWIFFLIIVGLVAGFVWLR